MFSIAEMESPAARTFLYFFGGPGSANVLRAGGFGPDALAGVPKANWRHLISDGDLKPPFCIFDVGKSKGTDSKTARITVVFDRKIRLDDLAAKDDQTAWFQNGRGCFSYWHSAFDDQYNSTPTWGQDRWSLRFASVLLSIKRYGLWDEMLADLQNPKFLKNSEKRPVLRPSVNPMTAPQFFLCECTGAKIKATTGVAAPPIQEFTLYFDELDIVMAHAFKAMRSIFPLTRVLGVPDEAALPDAAKTNTAQRVGNSIKAVRAVKSDDKGAVQDWNTKTRAALTAQTEGSGGLVFVLMSAHDNPIASLP
jgi:hypothetical protein